MRRNFAESRLGSQLAMLVFDAHIPLVRTVADLTPLQWAFLLYAWNYRVERASGETD
jgi:hypothetical protein